MQSTLTVYVTGPRMRKMGQEVFVFLAEPDGVEGSAAGMPEKFTCCFPKGSV